MPCDSNYIIKSESVQWNEARAREAIEKSGYKYVVQYNNGELTARTTDEARTDAALQAVRKMYGELTIKAAAKKFGFMVKSETTTKTGLKQLIIGRR